MSDLAVKIQNEDDVRRVNLKSTRFSDLLDVISTLFGIRADHYKICYLDEDKDSITVTTDLELKEALALAKKTNSTLRLLIKESKGLKVASTLPSQQANDGAKESTKESPQSTQEIFPATGTKVVLETINDGITALEQVANSPVQESQKKVDTLQLYEHEALCDNCKNKISGIRYKCGNCDDFDLCEKCELLRLHDEEHIFLKLYRDISPVKALLPLLYVPKPEPPKKEEPLVASFVKDVTVEEGTILKKGQKFTKIWKLKNDGKGVWTPGCRLVMTEGSSFGNVNFVEVPCAKPGEEVDISVDLVAPERPGRYVSYWRLTDSNGVRFGHRIWVDVSVAEDKPEPIAQPVVTQPVCIPVFQPISQPVVAQPVSDPVPVAADALVTGPMFQVKVSEKSLKIRDTTNLVDVEFIITKENELVFRVTATKEVRMKHHLTHLKRWAVIENAITLDFAEWESGFITLQTPIATQIGSLISNRIESILEQAVPHPVAPVPAPVTVQPVVEVPKVVVPEPMKEVLPEGITESEMGKLAELGFTDRKRNIELLVKHKRDLVQVVTALLEY